MPAKIQRGNQVNWNKEHPRYPNIALGFADCPFEVLSVSKSGDVDVQISKPGAMTNIQRMFPEEVFVPAA